MKALKHFFFSIFLFLFIFQAEKVHASTYANGAQIYWECHGNGKYVFYLNRLYDCDGITYHYINTTLKVVGSSLPRDDSNSIINAIILRPDSQKWNQMNRGDLSPRCSQGNQSFTCNNGNGFIQYFFRSDTIKLNGVPPADGWKFYHHNSSGFENRIYDNVSGNERAAYKAIMYADANNSNVSSCIDNSPKFIEHPELFFCRGESQQLSIYAMDRDRDSIAYSLDTPQVFIYNQNSYANEIYLPNYSSKAPLPSIFFDTLNQQLVYSATNGKVNFRVNSGTNREMFTVQYDAHAYRNGHRMSTTSYEIPVIIESCPALPNLQTNAPPRILPPFYKGGTTFSYHDSVVVGNPINASLQVRDTNTYNGNAQNIRIELFGITLAQDLRSSNNCLYASDTSCATLINVPQLDTIRHTYYYGAQASWSSIMVWQTDCEDLRSDGTAKTHYFYVKAQDDLCPIPSKSMEIIAITVLPDTTFCPGISTYNVRENNLQDEMRIYPNPSNGQVNIDRSSTEELQLEIYDLQGRKVESTILLPSESSIQLPEESGIYFLRLTDQTGKQGNFKVIKK